MLPLDVVQKLAHDFGRRLDVAMEGWETVGILLDLTHQAWEAICVVTDGARVIPTLSDRAFRRGSRALLHTLCCPGNLVKTTADGFGFPPRDLF